MPKPPSRAAQTARLSDAALAPLDDSVRMYPGTRVSIRGAGINVRITPTDAADAEPALFVHGLGGSAHNWTDLAGVLRNRLDVHAIDLFGHGRSDAAPDGDYSLRAHADTVIAYLEQSGRGPVHLAGNSMGGAVSIRVAGRRPDLVRSLTLISPAVPDLRIRIYPLRNDPRMAALMTPGLGPLAMRRLAHLDPARRVKDTIAMCFVDPSRYPARRLKESIEEVRARREMAWAAAAFLRSMRGLAKWQTLGARRGWATIRSITAPTLVLWGDSDRLVAPDLAPYVAAAIPNARLLVLERIGHTAMMEDPITTARAMLALIDDGAAAAAGTPDPAGHNPAIRS